MGYDKAEYIVSGFTSGFDIGHQGEEFAQAPRNARLAEENPEILGNLLDKEVKLGRFAGPFSHIPFRNMHISQLSNVTVVGQKDHTLYQYF